MAWVSLRGTRRYEMGGDRESPAERTGRHAADAPEVIAICTGCDKPCCTGVRCDRLVKEKRKIRKDTGKTRRKADGLKKYELDGRRYSREELAELADVHPATVTNRAKRGWTAAEIVRGYRGDGPKIKTYTYKGKQYTAPELAALGNMDGATLQARLRAGWSLEKAVETPLGRQGRRGVPHRKESEAYGAEADDQQ